MSKQIYLGKEFLEGFCCQFWMDPEAGGSHFRFPVNNDPYAHCVIAGALDSWWRTVGHLIHECHEFALTAQGLRFRSSSYMSEQGSDATVFVCTHDQLGETHMAVGGAMATILPKLSTEWKKARKARK